MEYFETFPKIYYDIAGNGNYKLITDILRRFKVRNRIQEDTVMFDKYEVTDGETRGRVNEILWHTISSLGRAINE